MGSLKAQGIGTGTFESEVVYIRLFGVEQEAGKYRKKMEKIILEHTGVALTPVSKDIVRTNNQKLYTTVDMFEGGVELLPIDELNKAKHPYKVAAELQPITLETI